MQNVAVWMPSDRGGGRRRERLVEVQGRQQTKTVVLEMGVYAATQHRGDKRPLWNAARLEVEAIGPELHQVVAQVMREHLPHLCARHRRKFYKICKDSPASALHSHAK
jgi:hypothetical protein